MKISSAFPSNYLKAADLDGRTVTLTIDRVVMEQIGRGEDPKAVIYFDGHTKGMVLNKTNAKKITEVYGDETENWTGGQISLFSTMVEFQGDTVAALRVRHVPSRQDSTPTPTPRQEAPPKATNPEVAPSPGSQASSLLVEAEAMTKQGIDAFRGWRDGLGPEEYQLLHQHMGRLIGMASEPQPLPKLSGEAKKLIKGNKTGIPF